MPFFLGPAFLHFMWLRLVLRCALAAAAGYGLMVHHQWGRLVAILAAVFSLIHFPFGTAMGIWTLVVLLGYRNQTLYEHL
jgi:ABC-type glycerol-3-phosphate transport system permease component